MWRRTLRGVSVPAALGVIVIPLGVLIACAQGQTSVEVDGDAGLAAADGGVDGRVNVPPRDGGTDAKKPADDGSVGPGCNGKVVINELQNDGPDGAEFVELFNPSDCAVDLAGWTIPYKAASGNSGVGIHSFEAGDTIPSGEFLLLGNDKFKGGATVTKFNGGGGLGNSGGQIALFDDNDTQIDAVGFGPGTTGDFVEQSPTPLPTGSGSVGRKTDGVDTDDNSADFQKFSSASPGVAN